MRYLASGWGGAPSGEPSEEAVVVDEPDGAAAGAGVAQRPLHLSREVADAASVVLLFRPTPTVGVGRGHRSVGHGLPLFTATVGGRFFPLFLNLEQEEGALPLPWPRRRRKNKCRHISTFAVLDFQIGTALFTNFIIIKKSTHLSEGVIK